MLDGVLMCVRGKKEDDDGSQSERAGKAQRGRGTGLI